jgi:hypothetical protein
VIHRDEAMDLLIEGCPSFLGADDLHQFHARFEDEGEPDFFIRIAGFAQHLVTLIEQGTTAELPPTFAAVEQILAEGDDQANELIELGLVEGLQNIVSHRDVPVHAEQVERFLGERARRLWTRLDELWARAGVHAPSSGPTEDEYDQVSQPDLKLYFRANTRALADGRLVSTGDVLKQEQRAVDRFRARQRMAMRWWIAGVSLLLVAFLVAGWLGR